MRWPISIATRQLEQKGCATPQLVDTQKAQVAQLQNAVKSDEALIDAAKVQLELHPADLADRRRRPAFVRSTSATSSIPTDPNGLVVVTQIEPISLIFTLPETDLPQIQQQQQKTKAPLTVLAYSQDDKIKLDEGKLGLVNNEILQTTGSIQLKANFPNTAHRLWPGELVNARLLLDTRHNGLTVPASVVQQGPQGAYAYVIDPDSTVADPPDQGRADQRRPGADRFRAQGQRAGRGRRTVQAAARHAVTILHGKAAEEAAAQSAQQAPIP